MRIFVVMPQPEPVEPWQVLVLGLLWPHPSCAFGMGCVISCDEIYSLRMAKRKSGGGDKPARKKGVNGCRASGPSEACPCHSPKTLKGGCRSSERLLVVSTWNFAAEF